MNARDVLNEIKWNRSPDLAGVEIHYLHRGAPDNTMIIHGKSVKSIGRHYLELESSSIPYHRILKIIFKGEALYEKP